MLDPLRHRIARYVGLTALLSLCFWAAGCQVGSFIVYAFNGTQKENIPAEYAGLKNSRYAVLVSADSDVLYQSPEAPRSICTAITRELASHVPGAVAVNPKQIIAFQEENPYWTTVPYSRLIKQLNVDQLVIVDIVQYNIHEKGNASIFRGTAIANVSIAKESDNDQLAYSKVVKATYPTGSAIGMIDSETDEQTFRLALLLNLSNTIGHLFYDYQIEHE
jgi:hypothetical protein